MKRSRETLALLLLLILGLVPRLAFVTTFPTIPTSDFNSLVAFGQFFHEHGIFSNGWFWEYVNPGLPVVLAADWVRPRHSGFTDWSGTSSASMVPAKAQAKKLAELFS